ncbi:uncharacterized protein K460DRAFT_120927 [Cucurbitaria berberidis CBS 394.84]|uniref:Uncharacterized protein n=1 Tax=Cucurbitaria berberidis CBS 394.84 TaxID=1168544 RepID=A0A9P4GIR7_9PLEO|nr:uncharacterized protein K460DRAFT_120927 [Cucurbitaria berberidis CBS 394.84]KAF1846166.1 hypothetical protein K460DRAFT_120927 [Cucurbitaria berberidis CBS 394.84]
MTQGWVGLKGAKMSTVETETPRSLDRTRSIFRRFKRREGGQTLSPKLPSKPISESSQPAHRKLQRRSVEAPAALPTPPASPRRHICEISKPIKSLQPQLITHIQRIEIPPTYHIVRDPPKHSDSNDLPRVLPTAMPTTAFPSNSQIRPWDVFLPPSQVYSLYQGFVPKDMSDKWFIYSEGPDQAGKLKVHFHRTWTGMKIAELFKYMIRMSCQWTLGVDLEHGK